MGTLILIRVYPIDDYIAYLCWQSWKEVLPDATIIFFAQSENDPPPGKYKWIIQTGDQILIRPYCCNFGGIDNVKACVEGLLKVDTQGYSRIIFSDADIIANKNPLDEDFDFGGVMQVGNERHYSGQVLLFDRDIFDRVVNYSAYKELFAYFVLDNYRSISDDTIFSWLATMWTNKVRNFYGMDYWTHTKLHHLEPK